MFQEFEEGLEKGYKQGWRHALITVGTLLLLAALIALVVWR